MEELRERRLAAGLTQRELAELAEVSVAIIRKVESGERSGRFVLPLLFEALDDVEHCQN